MQRATGNWVPYFAASALIYTGNLKRYPRRASPLPDKKYYTMNKPIDAMLRDGKQLLIDERQNKADGSTGRTGGTGREINSETGEDE